MMTYLIQVSVCWILFYAIYAVFLRKETFFSINRYYLLGALAAGLVIPLIGTLLPANDTSITVYEAMTYVSTTNVTAIVTDTTEKGFEFSWWALLVYIYQMGMVVVGLRFVYGLHKIYAYYKNGQKTKKARFTLVENDKYHLPFSFFNLIFLSKSLPLKKEIDQIIRHEELHASQWHSLDIIVTEILQIFFWFNPILIAYKKAIRQSHEYLADAYVTASYQKNSYGQLLLRQSTSGLEVALANQFFHSQIKKRITMMYTKKSKRTALVKYLAAVPVLAIMLVIFSSSQKNDPIANEYPDLGFDIQVEEDGVMIFPPTDKQTTIIDKYLKAVKEENDKVRIAIHSEAKSGLVTELINTAENNDIALEMVPHVEIKDRIIEASKDLFGAKSPIELNTTAQDSTDEEIFKVVEEMPRFPGCEDMLGSKKDIEDCAKKEMLNFIYTNLKYPAEARKANVEGMTVVQFTVKKDGSIADAKVVRDIGAGTKEEVLRVVNSFPTWKPGKQRGIAVNVQYTLPVKFKLEGSASTMSTLLHEVVVVGHGIPNDENSKGKEYTAPKKIVDVDVLPLFSGTDNPKKSQNKLLEHVYRNIKYPASSRENGSYGEILAQFDIDAYGKVDYAEIILGTEDEALGKAVLSAINSIPNWTPAQREGKNVRSSMALKVKFILQGEKEEQQTHSVAGKVTDENGNPLIGTSILIKGTESGTITDLQGKYQLETNKRDVMLVFNYVGFDTKVVEVNKKNNIDVTLKKTIVKDQEAKYTVISVGALKKIDNIRQLLPSNIFKDDCKMVSYQIVPFVKDKDVNVYFHTNEELQDATITELRTLKAGDRFFIENIKVKCGESIEDKGAKSFKVVNHINEKLHGKQSGINLKDETNIVLKSTDSDVKPLFILDGKEIVEGMEDVNPENIESINVLKGKKALEKYGDKGQNGVVEIISKSSQIFSNSAKIHEDKVILKGDVNFDITAKFDDPIIFVDGKEMSNLNIQEIDPNTIEEIVVYKGEKAVEKYGERARNGVIEVITKGNEGTTQEAKIYDQEVDEMPLFPGTKTSEESIDALLNFIGTHLKYPTLAQENGIEGTVVAQFVISKEGKILSIDIVRSVGWDIDKSVNNIINEMSSLEEAWTPALVDGENVNYTYTLPVKFMLQDNQKKEIETRTLTPKAFSISPNPNDGHFTLSYEMESKENVEINFYNAVGRSIKFMKDQPSSQAISVDLSYAERDIIYVNIRQGDKVMTKKVLKH